MFLRQILNSLKGEDAIERRRRKTEIRLTTYWLPHCNGNILMLNAHTLVVIKSDFGSCSQFLIFH